MAQSKSNKRDVSGWLILNKPYDELLKPFGLDARDPGFWALGLSMIEGLIAELEAMEPTA